MGFCFNRQLRMLHTVKNTVKHNKRREVTHGKVIHDPVIKRTTRLNNKLSSKDYSFLRSIGLKIRNPRKK